jgi:type VI secretion system protein ImpA
MYTPEQLLHPISAAQPCGADLSFSSELDAIARARQFDDPSIDQGEWVVALKEADWSFVAERCADLVATRSKDLRLAVWLAEARARTGGFRGLGDGFALLAGLCEQFWDDVYPTAEDGDQEQRIGNLFWLLARTPQLVGEITLTEGAETTFSMHDFAAMRQRAYEENSGGNSGEHPVHETSDPDVARRRHSAAFSAALQGDAEYCLQSLLRLEAVVDARLGANGPGFSQAREALEGVLHFIRPPESQSDVGVAMSSAGAGLAVSGTLQSRAQALSQLRLVADFFRRTEPHSPVAYLAEKAARWGELPLHLWLRGVVKDAAALAALEELLGSQNGDAVRG